MPSMMQEEGESEQVERLSRLRKKQATKRMEQLIKLHADSAERSLEGDETAHNVSQTQHNTVRK